VSPPPLRLTQRVLIVAAGRAAATGSIFAVNAILARAWSGPEFGLFCAVWVLGNTLVPVFLLGLPSALLYFYPRRQPAGSHRLVRQVAVCLAVSGLALASLLWVGGPGLARLFSLDAAPGSPELAATLTPFLPYVLAAVVGGYIDAALVASGRVTQQAGLSLLAAVGVVAAAAWGLVAAWSVPQLLLALSAVGMGRLALGTVLVAAATRGGDGAPATRGLGELLGYAWTIGLNDAAGSLSRSVDRLVVLSLFSAQLFGLYHVGAIEVPVSLLLAAAATVLVPEISRLHREGRYDEIATLWRGAVSRLSLIILPLFAFLLWFAGPLIAVYLPPQFAASRWVFAIFLLALPVRCAMYGPLLIGMGRARWALWGSLGDLGANLFLSLALARGLLAYRPDWAFLGPAVATVLATYGQVAVLLLLIGRDFSRSVGQLLPWWSLGRLALGCLAGAALARAATLALDTAAWQLATGAAVYAALGAILLHQSRDSRRQVREALRAAFSRRPDEPC